MVQPSEAPMDASLAALATVLPPVVKEIADTELLSEIHQQSVPGYAVEALDRLYGSLYASLRYLEICEATQLTPHSWVCYRRGEIIGVLLFRIDGSRVQVLTEMFALEGFLAEAFSQSVFSTFPIAHSIQFNAVSLHELPHRLCVQRFAFSENYILSLPDSVEAYEKSLGKSTRKTLKGYGNRIFRDYPGLTWHTFTANELPPHRQRELVLQLQEFKRQGMTVRGKRAKADARDTARMLTLIATSGLFGAATQNGRLFAGSVACRVGDNYIMLLSAADPEFSSYRLGFLSCYWAIRDCIQQGGRECHLLWGRYQYKEQLLAFAHVLYQLKIYRSRLRKLCDPASVITLFWRSWHYRLRHCLLTELPRRSAFYSRCLTSALEYWRRLR